MLIRSRHTNIPRITNQANTCPICRESLDTAKNHWVLAGADAPDVGAMPDVVLGLVDKAKGESLKTSPSRPRSLPAMSNTASPQTLHRPTSHIPRHASGITEEPVEYTATCTPEGYTLISCTELPESNDNST